MPKRSTEYMAAQRDGIVDAAISVFAEKGFRHASTDDIASAAGCGKSVMYRHFQSKQQIIGAIWQRQNAEIERAQIRDLQGFISVIVGAWRDYDRTEGRKLLRMSFELAMESLSDPTLVDWERLGYATYLRWIERMLRNEPAAAGLSGAQRRVAARRLLYFWGGQGLYKVLVPSLPLATLRRDLLEMSQQIIAGAAASSRKRK